MNSLSLGFLYVVGISWALAETCIIASDGNWIPLVLFLIGFTLMFAILGCVKISDRAVELWGGVFAMALAVGLVLLTAVTAMSGAIGATIVKGIFAAVFVIAGLITLLSALKPAAH